MTDNDIRPGLIHGGQGRSAEDVTASAKALVLASLCAGSWLVVWGLYKLAAWVLA